MRLLPDRFQVQVLRALGATSGHLPTAVGRLHAIDIPGRGALPPLCLLHGLSSAGADYTPFIQRLRPHVRRILTLDLPGHGLSQSPPAGLDAAALRQGLLEGLDRLLDEPAVLFGNSLGGMAALRYAVARPHRVRGLFLSSPAGAPMDPADLRALVDSFAVRSHAEARAFLARAFAGRHALHPLMAMGFQARTARPALQHLLATLRPEDLLAPDELSALPMPVLVSWGQEEAVLPRGHVAFWRAHLPPHAVLEEPARHGHAPFVTHTAELAARVVRFLAEEVAPPPRAREDRAAAG